LEKALDDRFKAHNREHELISKSIVRAREVVDNRLEGMNELRAQINSERGQFVERQNFDTYKDGIATQMGAIASRIGSLESRLTTIAAVAAFLMPVAIFVVNFFFSGE
jgi:hypothetical protein